MTELLVQWRSLRSPLLIALGYFLGAKVGFALTLQPVPVSTLWPPNAILLAGLLLTPLRHWGVVLVFVFVAHLIVQVNSGVPIVMVLCWFVSNCTEALIGAAAVRRFAGHPPAFDRFRQVAVFLLCAGFLGPFLSSFLDVWFVTLNQWGGSHFWTVWRTRFFSNVLATLTLVPVILTLADLFPRLRPIPPRRWFEAGAGSIALLTICWFVFVRQQPGPSVSPALLYAPLPLLVWAALRFGPLGASTSLLVCALVAIVGATRGQGPFVAHSPPENALAIQLFLIVTWIPVMSLAAVIRERVRAEKDARRSEEQLGLALDAVRLGRWEWELAGAHSTPSETAPRPVAINADGAADSPTRFLQAVHPDDRQMVSRAIVEAIGHSGVLEVEFRTGDERTGTRWMLAKGKTLDDDAERPSRMVGITVDISDRKRTDLQIREQQRALAHRDRVSLAGELSVALAHEINQPLAAILTNARAAKRFLMHDPPDLEQVRESLDAIADDDQRAAAVIRRLHAVLKTEQVRWQPVSINAVITEVIGIARADAIARGVSLVTELMEGLPPVAGDRHQLQQLLLHLVNNACEAMASTAIGARRLSVVTSLDASGGVVVSVTDTGKGIPADQVEQIFEPFVSSKPGGLGLGLTISRSIVDAHGGRLWAAEAQHGGGSISFTIPAASASAS